MAKVFVDAVLVSLASSVFNNRSQTLSVAVVSRYSDAPRVPQTSICQPFFPGNPICT